jgi:uncharacterized protein
MDVTPIAAFKISPLFAGFFVLLQIPLTIAVGLYRARTGIQFFDGGDTVLLRRMRAHGNFTETVPITLIAMAAAECSGAPAWLLVAGGGSLVLGRLLHYATLVRSGFGVGRAAGMVLTLLPMATFGGWALSRLLW